MASNQYDAQASTNYKEAFALFDKRGNGRVTIDSLGDLLRACGQNPTLSEIRDLEKNVGGDCELTPFICAEFFFFSGAVTIGLEDSDEEADILTKLSFICSRF
jgi:Ca2+-binding EF-hand superfamily protein